MEDGPTRRSCKQQKHAGGESGAQYNLRLDKARVEACKKNNAPPSLIVMSSALRANRNCPVLFVGAAPKAKAAAVSTPLKPSPLDAKS
jgi:hypothetical protein